MNEENILVEFKAKEEEFESLFELIELEFENEKIFKSNAASGSELIILFASSTPLLISKLFDVYLNHRSKIKSAKIKMKDGKKEIEISNISPKQLKELINNGSLEKLKEIVKNKK